MKTNTTALRLVALCIAMSLSATPALAEKPEWAGQGGKGKHEDKHEDKADKHARKEMEKAEKHSAKHERKGPVAIAPGTYFNDGHRTVVRTYYSTHYGGGKACPPGLAKKNNGCMPPGQARKWNVGQRIPTGITYYAVPQPVLVQLPPAPMGYRYVRVSTDVLLIAISTAIVVDVISDLMR